MTKVHLMAHRAFLGGGDREPSAASVAAALFSAAAAGGVGVLMIYAVPMLFLGVGEGGDLGVAVVFVLCAATVLIGVLVTVVGGPCWWVLHILGIRGWASAVLLGLCLSTVFFVTNGLRGIQYPLSSLAAATPFIPLAGGVGFVAWKVAYDTDLAQARVSDR